MKRESASLNHTYVSCQLSFYCFFFDEIYAASSQNKDLGIIELVSAFLRHLRTLSNRKRVAFSIKKFVIEELKTVKCSVRNQE
jgi:hypothetical protein